ncbi:MAG TPA: tetratricopeptide repeat protein [Rhodanobacteraceae bacterium]|nr:tetratricopeptide repeat protein [Rhodanobacteraceae bacterium]
MADLWQRLKQRKLVQWALAYTAAAWALLQALGLAADSYDWPHGVMRVAFAVIALGFVVALVLAWYHGERGAQRVTGTELLILALLLAIGGGLLWRFTRAPEAAPVPVPPASTSSANAVEIPPKSIAVLPFENLSDDKANAYFADGMQDEILTRLSKIGTLRVISRTSTLQFASHPENLPEIAKKLGVATILEGSVQKAGNKVRIIVQLIHASDDRQLWGETYDRTLDDVFGVQGEVAGTIADKLGATLTGDARKDIAQVATRNPVALDAYLRGMALNRQGFTDTLAFAALKSYGEAVKADPDFAQAWAAIARMDSFMIFLGIDGSPERRASALQALQSAERLQPDALETLVARAIYEYGVERDFESARKRFAQVLVRWPNDVDAVTAMVHVLEELGRYSEAETLLEHALQLDPLNPRLYKNLAILQTNERRFDAALDTLDRALALVPDDEEVRQLQGDIYLAQGDLERAAKAFGKPPTTISDQVHQYVVLARMQRRYPPAIAWLQGLLARPGDAATPPDVILVRLELAELQWLNGDRAAAADNYRLALEAVKPLLERQPDNPWLASMLAIAHAGLGDETAAMAALDRLLATQPESKSAQQGRAYLEIRARVLASIGHKDEAIARLRYLLGVPYGGLFAPVTPASLRLDPEFDALRSDPAFQKLLQDPPAAKPAP